VRAPGPAPVVLTLVIAASAWPVPPCAAQPACPSPGLRIGRITVDRRPVFDTAPGDRSFSARLGALANPLHIGTRERVIRDELLFKEGEPCRDEALAQSERNLRARGLFQTVAITTIPGPGAVVDVHVAAQDAWTLRASGDLARIGGALVWEIGLADTNVAGEGFGIGVRHREDIGARVTSGWIEHERLFGTRERLSLSADDRSDGDAWGVSLSRPFFAIGSTWSHELSAGRQRDHWRLYDAGEVTGESGRTSTGVVLRLARRVGPTRPDRAWRVGAGYRFSAVEFDALGERARAGGDQDMPPSHRYGGPFASVQFVEHRFEKRRGLIVPSRDLDLNLGWQFGVSGWVSLETASLQTESRAIVSASVGRGWTPGSSGVVTASAGVTLRTGGSRPSDADATGAVRAWWPHSAVHVTAVMIDLRSLVNPEPGYRLYLGGSTGLAGYREFAAYATRTASVQVEERRYLPWTPAGLVQVGVAAFAGAGALGGDVSPALPRRVLADAGFGLRFALLKSPSNSAARLDVAFPLTTGPDGRHGPLLVVGYQRSF
jgi:hypothetical protein